MESQCMNLGWGSKYIKLPLEMLSYGQLLNFISASAEPFFYKYEL